MKQFEHLSIFVSMIIALGVRHLILSVVQMINLRGKVRIYFPTIVWIVFLILLQLQIWWVMFYQHDTADWRFFKFLVFLSIPIIISMSGHLLLPEIKPETDLKEIYYHNRKWFFGLFVTVAFVGLTQGDVASGGFHFGIDLFFRFTFFALSVVGLLISSKRLQLPISIAFLCWIIIYVSLFFTRLG